MWKMKDKSCREVKVGAQARSKCGGEVKRCKGNESKDKQSEEGKIGGCEKWVNAM